MASSPPAPNESDDSNESESFVISVPPGEWPPAVLSSTSDGTTTAGMDGRDVMGGKQPQELDRSAPLPTGATTSSSSSMGGGDDGGSPRSRASQDMPSEVAAIAAISRDDARDIHATKIAAPSYYKIELVRGGGGGDGDGDEDCDTVVQLTAGDDSSVQLGADHNEGLRLISNAEDDDDDRTGPRHGGHEKIIRASPIVELDAIEHEATEEGKGKEHEGEGETAVASRPQRWTVSDKGRIVAVPPSPSSVAAASPTKPRHHHNNGRSPSKHHGDEDDKLLDIPPLMVKASCGSSSSCSSGSSSSVDSFLSEKARDDDDIMPGEDRARAELEGAESESLESPPRLDRSVITPSLFQDSVNGSSHEKMKKDNNKRSSSVNSGKSRSSSGSTTPSMGGGRGCGFRGGDFLSQILDVFSLSGGCCHQNRDVACS